MSNLQLDSHSLLLAQITLAFITSPFTSPTYNFPLFLFGVFAVDKTESHDPLRLFSGLLGVSSVLDIVWLFKTKDQSGFISTLTVINLILKAPTFFSVLTALRQRGDSFGSFGELGAQNVWTMPGSFGGLGSRPGYENVDEDVENGARTSAPPVVLPPKPVIAQQTAPGGYQTIA